MIVVAALLRASTITAVFQAGGDAPPSAPAVQASRQEDLERRIAEIEKQLQELRAAAKSEPPADSADYHPSKTPFAFGDLSWAPGGYAPQHSPLQWGAFTGEVRVDTAYHYSFNRPKDDTISGSSEVFRHNELQLTQLGIGGDLYYKGVQARLMTQFGMYSQTTPRNDASPSRGQWNLDDAYRYISEAYAGYHVDYMDGVNVQAGIFMSYVGLWSYYNFDNWTYQPSYVSSNTPWFFEGVRVQFFPTEHLKIEPYIVNGWQSYGKFNDDPGYGLQVRWFPNDAFSVLTNEYYGQDTLGLAHRTRFHSDNSAMVKYYDAPEKLVSKAAMSLTVDAGFETGDGAHWDEQYFLGFMAYNRVWFADNKFALCLGGGAINNPGRYLVLLPPVNGATASSGTPFFTQNPGDPFRAWDLQIAADYMPEEHVIFRLEFNRRVASVPYFAGHGGVTPPGGNQGAPGSDVPGFTPDLVRSENRITLAMMVRF